MATNIDKALYQQPTGIEELAQDESPLEIEIVDPEEVNIGIDGMEIRIKTGQEDEEGFSDNLAEYMDDGALESLAGDWGPTPNGRPSAPKSCWRSCVIGSGAKPPTSRLLFRLPGCRSPSAAPAHVIQSIPQKMTRSRCARIPYPWG